MNHLTFHQAMRFVCCYTFQIRPSLLGHSKQDSVSPIGMQNPLPRPDCNGLPHLFNALRVGSTGLFSFSSAGTSLFSCHAWWALLWPARRRQAPSDVSGLLPRRGAGKGPGRTLESRKFEITCSEERARP